MGCAEYECCSDVDEPLTLVTEKIVVARKQHTCGECQELIPVGSKYEITTGMSDGRWLRYKTCLRCLGVRTDCFKCGWFYGRLREDFKDCNNFDYVDEPAKLWQLREASDE